MSARRVVETRLPGNPRNPAWREFLHMMQPPFVNLDYNVRMLLQGNSGEQAYSELKRRLAKAENRIAATVWLLAEYGYDRVPAGYISQAFHALSPEDKAKLNAIVAQEILENPEVLDVDHTMFGGPAS